MSSCHPAHIVEAVKGTGSTHSSQLMISHWTRLFLTHQLTLGSKKRHILMPENQVQTGYDSLQVPKRIRADIPG